jgi:2-amino-4-hydroxy-6-hydroxymethyldihydropteridine diphosphokinase
LLKSEYAVLGFGSNAGNRMKNIKEAVKMLALNRAMELISLSQIYETEPWGFKKQKNFLNCAGVFLCRTGPGSLLKNIKTTEKKIGRVTREKWQKREIDIDILFFGSRIITEKGVVIPHPYISERNFVLKPLVEIIPDFVHPVKKKSIYKLSEISRDKCKVKPVKHIF